MGRLKLSERNPDFRKPDGTLLYDRRERFRIWKAKILSEFFSDRKPSHTQQLQLSAAVVLILSLSENLDPSGEISAGRSLSRRPKNNQENDHLKNELPKNFLTKFNTLQRILAGFKPQSTRSKKAAKDAGPSLAAILGRGDA
jgi:hypothetical protein